jgi:hypothetical protein
MQGIEYCEIVKMLNLLMISYFGIILNGAGIVNVTRTAFNFADRTDSGKAWMRVQSNESERNCDNNREKGSCTPDREFRQ